MYACKQRQMCNVRGLIEKHLDAAHSGFRQSPPFVPQLMLMICVTGERLVIGGLSGGIAQLTVYPLEVVQARLAATTGVYQGITDVVRQTILREGYHGFYR